MKIIVFTLQVVVRIHSSIYTAIEIVYNIGIEKVLNKWKIARIILPSFQPYFLLLPYIPPQFPVQAWTPNPVCSLGSRALLLSSSSTGL